MKRKALYGLAAALVGVASVGMVRAESGYAASFSTSITYQNVGANPANIVIEYYKDDGSKVPFQPPVLAAGASSSVFAGSVTNLTAGFQGSAILSSNEPVVATLVQIAQGATTEVKNRPLSNGFSSGSSKVLIATTLKNAFGVTTRFSVQNASGGAENITVKFFNTTSSTPVHTVDFTGVPAGSAKYVDLGTIAPIPDGFSGSATVEAVATTGGAPAEIVASALELGTASTYAAAFEGVSGGSSKVYMPSALCAAFGGYNSAYAVQNTGAAAATVNVNYANGATQSATIQPGAKASFQTCAATGATMTGYSGSATIDAGAGTIVAIGKVSGLGVTTAFVGANGGAAKLACPYVRWSESQFTSGEFRQRVFLAIQNIGTGTVSGATVKYVNKDGVQVGATQTLADMVSGGKANSKAIDAGAAAAEFGYVGGFGGGAIIEGPAGSQLVAIARVQSTVGAGGVGEDYNCQATN